MLKLLVLLVILGQPSPAPYQYVPQWEEDTNYAGMCHLYDDGMDCQEIQGQFVDEVCWCSKQPTYVYCNCMFPDIMSRYEWLEYLIYRGKPNEVRI